MRRIKGLQRATLGLFIFAAALSFLFTVPSHAAEHTTGLEVAPAILDTGGEPGSEVELSFLVTNKSEKILPISLGTRDSRLRDGQKAELMRQLSAKEWIEYDEPDFILEPNESQTVKAKLVIPEDAPPGGHYADLIVQTLSLQRDDGLITPQPEVIVQLLASVAGDIREKLSVSISSGSNKKFINPTEPGTVTFEVKNNGNIHNMFMPALQLTRKRQEAIEVRAQAHIVLPGEIRKIDLVLPADLQPGLYKAQLLLSYGTPLKEAASPKMTLFVLPFDPRLLLIAPVFLLAVLTHLFRRRILTAARVIAKGE